MSSGWQSIRWMAANGNFEISNKTINKQLEITNKSPCDLLARE
jgi:hypothetical protein